MLRTTLAKALVGVAALGVAGGTTALAASPGASTPAQNAAKAKHPRHLFTGEVTNVTDRTLTVSHPERKTATSSGSDKTVSDTFAITSETALYRAGSKVKLSLDALKAGERVRVAYAVKKGDKVARRVVILRDVRVGKVLTKGNDSFTMKTARGDVIKVTVSDHTSYIEGPKGHTTKGSFADLKVGDGVVVRGTADGHDNFDAAVVRSHAKDAA